METLSPALCSRLLEPKNVDLAFRLQNDPDKATLVIMASTDAAHAEDLEALFSSISAKTGFIVADSSRDYDRITSGFPTFHLRLDQNRYTHNGEPVACEVRLYTAYHTSSLPDDIVWQGHFRRHEPSAEDIRRTRHYIARIKIEEPFTERIRDMQIHLANRCLEPGWLADEFLCFPTGENLATMKTSMRDHFKETLGRMGFDEPPIYADDASEWLSSGLHSTRFADEMCQPNVLGANLFPQAEVEWILRHSGRRLHPDEEISSSPEIFISYSSADYATATAVCEIIEALGHTCWLAPRDINRSLLPYPSAIEKAIGSARVLIVILSDSANLSVHIPREVDMALERRLPVIPLRIHNVVPKGQLNYLLRTCQWVDTFDRDLQAVGAEIIARLRTQGI
jgi:hypothetical protein